MINFSYFIFLKIRKPIFHLNFQQNIHHWIRALIAGGLLLMLSAMTWLTVTMPRFGPGDRSNLPYFAVGVILDLAGIPTVCDIGLSLYSKLLPSSMQVHLSQLSYKLSQLTATCFPPVCRSHA